MQTFSYGTTPPEVIKAAHMADKELQGRPFNMKLVGHDAELVMDAVNQGIDSHLEACNFPDLGDSYVWYTDPRMGDRRLRCNVSVQSLPVLLRRLFEFDDDDEAMSLRSGILGQIGIEEI